MVVTVRQKELSSLKMVLKFELPAISSGSLLPLSDE